MKKQKINYEKLIKKNLGRMEALEKMLSERIFIQPQTRLTLFEALRQINPDLLKEYSQEYDLLARAKLNREGAEKCYQSSRNKLRYCNCNERHGGTFEDGRIQSAEDEDLGDGCMTAALEKERAAEKLIKNPNYQVHLYWDNVRHSDR